MNAEEQLIPYSNSRRNRTITAFGETHPLAEWSRKVGISASLITARLGRLGWPVERALRL